MKIVLSENQFKNLYNVENRPHFTDIDYIVETEDDGETHDLGEPGEPQQHNLYYYYIAEKFYDKFYDETYLELFKTYSKEKDCDTFVYAVIDRMIEKIKNSILDNSASKILKKVIRDQKVVKFKLSDLKDIFEKHFGNIMCHEYLEDLR